MRRLTALLIAMIGFGLLSFDCQLFAAAKIVAIVNNDAITEKDLDDVLRISRVQLSRQFKGKELKEQLESLKKDLLQQLIEQRLILQEANRILENARKLKDNYAIFRLEIKQDKIKQMVDEIKKKYGSDEEFQKDLNKEGLTQADIENRIKEEMLTESIIDYWVKERVTVRPEEVTEFYNKNPKDFESGEERELLAISVDNNDLAASLSYSLRTGQKLEDLATRYPFAVNKLSANKVKGELRKDIEDTVFKLGLNEVSSPLKVEDKYYVFILQNITPSRKLALSEVQPQVYNYLFKTKVHEEIKKWLEGLKKDSYIKITQ